MSLYLQIEVLFQVLLAALLSMVVGFDREAHKQPAGLRTHMLVGIGSCLFTALSAYAFPGSDPTRIAAQIVAGVGFLGAGTIIQRENRPHHLTTAASIWATAAVGMAVGAGAWFLAVGSTLIVWAVLVIVRWFSKAEFANGSNHDNGDPQSHS
jgi:putative Mg2+ transporter-C (MgtC) family protein